MWRPHLQSIKKGSQEVPVRAADNDLVTDHNVLGQDLKLLIAKDLQEKYTHYNLVTDHNMLSWDLKLLIAKIWKQSHTKKSLTTLQNIQFIQSQI